MTSAAPTFGRGSLVLPAFIASLLLAFPSPVHAVDPCAVELGATALGELASVDISGEAGDGGIGGTGLRGADSGIGGTGVRGADDSGVGGTGLTGDGSGIGGTGIFGTVTAFGSVCVNGLRIHYAADASVLVNGRHADTSALEVGQVVWIRATRREGRFETDQIEVHSAVVGRIDAIDVGRRALIVDGQAVLVPGLSAHDVIVGGGGFEVLRRGGFVDVSGLRDEVGVIVASRVAVLEDTPSGDHSSLRGQRIADLLAGARGLRTLSVEGYVSGRVAGDVVRVDGLSLDLSGASKGADRIDPGTRIRTTGRLAADGTLRVERLSWPPRRPEARTPGAAPPVRESDADPPTLPATDRLERVKPADTHPLRPELPPHFEKPEPIIRPHRSDRPTASDIRPR